MGWNEVESIRKAEVRRINSLLEAVLERIKRSALKDDSVNEINDLLETEFDLNISKLIGLSDSEFLNKINEIHVNHLDKLIELLYELIIHDDSSKQKSDKDKMKHKISLMIDYMDKVSGVFSFSRMNIKQVVNTR